MSSKATTAKRRAAVRRRRTLLGLLAILAVLAVVLLVWRPWAAGEAPPSTAPNGATGAPAQTDAATESPTPSPTPSGPFTPVGGTAEPAEPTEPCAPEQVAITPAVDQPSYAADERVRLSFTIENTGEGACSLNAGTTVQEYEIRSGDEVVYRWSDCAADVQDNVVQLEPDAPQSTVPIEWDRTASSIETCTAERPQVPAGGETYELSVRVGEYAGREGVEFVLE